MYLTKKHLPRRTFLRGLGVTLSLPLLESMVPARATTLLTNAAAPKTRFVGVFSAHGWAQTYWADNNPALPPTAGRNVGLGFVHQPLEPVKDTISIINGLDATASMPPPGSSGGDHQRSSAVLTGALPKKTSGSDIWCGPSIDQMIAGKHGQDTLLPSIQLAIEDPGSNTGVCGYGYSCVYQNSISWAAPDKPLPHEINPAVVFERLFGAGGSDADRTARRATNASILDAITDKAARLRRTLPAGDQHRLGDYLENIRELERRMQLATRRSVEAPQVAVPFGVPESFDEHIKLMWDLQLLAFQADITRVSTLMYSRDLSLRTYPEAGVATANHPASHHGEDPARLEEWAKINRYHIKTLAYFLEKARATPDGDGTLLDHMLLLWTSNMGNSNQHSHVNVGQLLAGGAGGAHKPKLIRSAKGSTSNLLLTALHMMNVEADRIGDSTGPIALT